MTTPRTTTHRAPPPLPALRATVFALVGTVLGMSAHQTAAGGPMPWRQGGVAAAVLLAVGLVGARRPRSLASVLATCGGAQTALHLWLTRGHAPGGIQGHVHAHAGSLHQQHPYDSQAMAAAHAAAALLVAVLLHRADAACWSLAHGLTTMIAAIRALPAVSRPAPAVPRLPAPIRTGPPRPPLRGTVLADVVVRRGPPRAGLSHAN